MAVIAHAEHDHVGGQRKIGQARAGGDEFLVFAQPRVGERSEGGDSRVIAQKRFAHQPRVRARTVLGDAALVGERDRHAGPIERLARQRFEEAFGRLTAGHDQQGRAALGDRRAQLVGGPLGEGRSKVFVVGEVATQKVIRHRDTPRSRCVRPVRSTRRRRSAPRFQRRRVVAARASRPRPRGQDR